MRQPFRIDVPDDVLDDLRQRVARARFAAPSSDRYWSTGVDPGWLKDLADYWANEFDWRSIESGLNAHPQFVATINGAPLHYVHIPAETQPAVPIILAHG